MRAMGRRLLALAAAVLILVGTGRADGELMREETYFVETFEDLKRLSEAVSEGDGPYRGRVELINDIDADGPLMPVGSPDHMFLGAFEGNGHVISGLRTEGEHPFSGLFGFVGVGGSVKNVVLTDVRVNGLRYAGGVAGYSMGTIENCTVSGGQVIVKSGLEYGSAAGGIVGVSSGRVSGCVNENTLVAGYLTVGGIAGAQCYEEMSGCLSSGDVHSWFSGDAQAGGVVGAVQTGGCVSSCIGMGEVRAARGAWAGGVAGAVLSGSVKKCAFLGTVDAREPGAVAGFLSRRAQAMGCMYDAAAGPGVGEGREDGTYPHLRGAMIRKDISLLLPLTGSGG